MDLSIPVKDFILNIRATVLLQSTVGYLFEQDKLEGFFTPIGGRIKVGESSLQAAQREIEEEIGVKDLELDYVGVLENFFCYNDKKCHELNFIYKGSSNIFKLLPGFKEIAFADIELTDIKPAPIKELLLKQLERKQHFIYIDSSYK